MGEYEPEDSRKVTLGNSTAPGEPPRTGPREGETRDPNSKGEQGIRAAPQSAADEPADSELGQTARSSPNQAGQSQSQSQTQSRGGQTQSLGGQTQSLGGMSQSQGRSVAALQPEPEHGQTRQASPPATAQYESGLPTGGDDYIDNVDGNTAPDPAGTPQAMQQADPDAERKRREQAASQSGTETPQNMGEPDRPEGEDDEDGLDPDEAGYGGGGEERLDKINKDG